MTMTKVRTKSLQAKSTSTIKYYKLDAIAPPEEDYLSHTEGRMIELNRHHIISQSYVLPVPYLCQVHHLLNLKHLESVHNFSLNGLKIGSIGQLEQTATGGSLKFETTLNPVLNLLKIWRQPVVEVCLTLHTPYTIELTIPVYHGRNLTIVFNILPLGDNAHKLFIDIYSAIVFPKPVLQLLLHFAAYLTVFEDMPYLRKLANCNLSHKFAKTTVSHHKTMQLLKRFVELYGCNLDRPKSQVYRLSL